MAAVHHPLDDVLAAALPAGSLYAVGGRVRDELRRTVDPAVAAPKDLDYVVIRVPLAELKDRLECIGRVDEVGASFAVLKFRHPAGEADIALPRRERSTGVAHRAFAVESGPEIPLEDDLARRDFRMNMIARRVDDGAVIDPYGGIDDVRMRRVDVARREAFAEDPLRMLRAAQFAARFGYRLTASAREAMAAAAALVATVSGERIGDEVGKLMLAAAPSVGVEILRETGVLAHLWPELLEGIAVDQNEWHAYDVYRHALASVDAAPVGHLAVRLAALLHDIGKPRTAEARPDGRGNTFYRHEIVGADLVVPMLERLRLSNAVIDLVTHLVRHHMYAADADAQDRALRRFVRRIGTERLDAQFALRHADIAGSGLPKRDDANERFEARVAAIVAERPPFTLRDLAFDGAGIIVLLQQKGLAPPGFRGDARVGEVLRALFEEVTDDPSRNEPGLLATAAGRYIDAHFGAGR